MRNLFLVGLIALGCVALVYGHGRFLEPPSRASAWRYGFGTPVNWNDNELFCGGLGNQLRHDYKCGICGDPWQGPREHEAGGKYATGTIVRHYQKGSQMDVLVQLTTNHLGYIEFRLCPHNDVKTPAKKECFDNYLLERADGQGTRYNIQNFLERNITMTMQLPRDVTCSQCIVQWKYHTGNRWGRDPVTGVGCRGCGPQEEFYGCADVSIN